MNDSHNIELVFLPGLDGTGLSYEPLGKVMPKEITVTIVSYPSHARLSFQQLVESAYDQIPHDKPLVLIAESFSGPIAVRLVATKRVVVKGIVFCASFMKFERPFLITLSGIVPLSFLLKPPLPNFVFPILCGKGPALKELSPVFRKIERQLDPKVLSHRIRMLRSIDVRAESHAIRAPCCYIQALHDRLVPASSVLSFVEHLPGITIKKIEGPHGILQAKPQECAGIITEFVMNISKK